MRWILTAVVVACFLPLPMLLADEPANETVRVSDDFESGMQRWQPLDEAGWRVAEVDGNQVLSQYLKASDYRPPHRSPGHIALLKDIVVGDFDLTVRVRSTHEDYGHRDMCLFFGYQDSAHFYYVHLGKRADDHANQIFIVNEAARQKISLTSTDGTPWDDEWHTVRIERRVEEGEIRIFYDNMEQPVMTASDITFAWGQVGLGSFDDTGDWDDFILEGAAVERR